MKKILQTAIAIVFFTTTSIAQVAGYSFSQFSGAYTAVTGGTVFGTATSNAQRFVDPAVPNGGTTNTGVGIPIGFNFTYNQITFDRFAISTNGWISLGHSTITPNPVNIQTGNQNSFLSATSTAPATLQNRIGALGTDLQGQTGSEIRAVTIGTAPNRTLVVQWTNYRVVASTGDNLNFQIRLSETTNNINCVYGSFVTTSTANAQIGLRGSVNTDFNNRDVTASNVWATSIAGIANNSQVNFSSTLFPVSGQNYQWTPPPPCSGAPGPNTSVTNATTVCSGGSANLSFASIYTVLGLTYQWYVSTTGIAGPYTAITGATTTAFTATNITTASYFQAVVTCSNSAGTITTTPVQVTINTDPCQCNGYCSSAASVVADDEIFNVSIGTLNNTSSCLQTGSSPSSTLSLYSNYTGIIAAPNLIAGSNYTLDVTVGQCDGSPYSGGVTVYMDFNNNGSFADPGEQVFASANTNWAVAGTLVSTVITIPASANPGITRMRVIAEEANVGTLPCAIYSYGETEDYCINIVAGAPCAGAPGANSAVTSATNVCPNGSANLGLATSYTVGGLTYQWFSAPALAGPYTAITGATSSIYTATNIATTTFYQCVITCTNGPASTTATPVQVMVGGSPCQCGAYCASAPSNPNDDEIFNVSIGTLNNTSSCSQTGSAPTSTLSLYSNYTGIVAAPNLIANSTYTLDVTVGQCDGFSYSGGVTVYMDFNQNGSFADPGEQVFASGITSWAVVGTLVSTVITIPASITPGITRMRVIADESNTSTPECSSYFYGETEDYCINLIAGTPCAGAPGANSAVASSTNVCPNGSTNLGLATSYTVGGLTYQWFSAPALAGPYTAITGATSSVYTATNISAATVYQAVITCTNGPASTTSTPVQITVGGNPCQCAAYCSSAPSNTADDEIFNVSIGTLNNTSNCSQTGSAPTSTLNLYSNYAGIVAAPNLIAGNNYTLDVTVGQCNGFAYSGGVTVYMDFNQNGNFADPGEQVFASVSTLFAIAGTLVSTVITIPSAATPGTTRMRVIADESNVNTPDCSSYFYGETEDYCINITAGCAVPNVTLTASQTTVCNGTAVNLTASGATTYTWNTTANTSSISVTPSVTTSYTVMGENTPGCPDTETITITVNPSPTIAVAAAPSLTLCPGMSTSLTASGANTYTWNPGNFTTAAISVTPAISTVYNVAGTNSIGCTTNSNITVFVVVCTGLGTNAVIENTAYIYPNPNTGEFTIELNNGTAKNIQLMDLTGRVILSETTADDKINFNINTLANGIYYVRIQSNKTVEVFKVIKQ